MFGWIRASNADIWHDTISSSKGGNMVKFINRFTGTVMWVAEDRVEEYKAAGHRLAVALVPEKKPAPKRRKTTKK